MKRLIGLTLIMALLLAMPCRAAGGGVYASEKGKDYTLKVGEILTFQNTLPKQSEYANDLAMLIYVGTPIAASGRPVHFHVSLDGEDYQLMVHSGGEFVVGKTRFLLKAFKEKGPGFPIEVKRIN